MVAIVILIRILNLFKRKKSTKDLVHAEPTSVATSDENVI